MRHYLRRFLAVVDTLAFLTLAALLAYLAFAVTCTASEGADAWCARDKQLHAVGGFAIGAVAYLIVENVAPERPTWQKHAVAIGSALVVGVVKEVVDHQDREHHTSDWRDAVAGAAGGAVGSFAVSFTYQF